MKSGRQILWVLYNWGRLTTFKLCNRRKLLKVLLKINNNIKHFPSSPYQKHTNNAFLQFYGKVTGATRGIFSVVRTIKLFFDEKILSSKSDIGFLVISMHLVMIFIFVHKFLYTFPIKNLFCALGWQNWSPNLKCKKERCCSSAFVH